MNLRIANCQLPITFHVSRLAFLILPLLFAAVIILTATPARAMPEYATRVGEPCATCHVSPAGGGLRNVRGQAWVASDKPATVPSTTDALKVLGIELPADMSIYTTVTLQPMPARFNPQLEKYSPLIEHLMSYHGN